MPSPRSYRGTVASRGYAEGNLFSLDEKAMPYRPSNDPALESDRLKDAIAIAASELTSLVVAASGDAADIREFQLAMVEDEVLSEPALASIAEGKDAAGAWQAALEAETRSYLSSDSEYFRARAADLRDIERRVLRTLTGASDPKPPPGAILVGDDITPSVFLDRDWGKGGAIILRQGSAASHVAMLARSRGVPMLVAVANLAGEGGESALVDAEAGAVTLSPDTDAVARFRNAAQKARSVHAVAAAMAAKPAVTADGTAIAVHVNIASPDELGGIDAATCDGIGLMRTEFLYGQGLPDEDTQYDAYARVLEWAAGKRVVIRTVDAGGDKPVPGFTVEESNPFLGLRGIRLALAKPEIFGVQIRALLRAGKHGHLRVMFPMIATAGEFAAAKALFVEEAGKLGVGLPQLGIMVEVPAVAVAPELLKDATFFSIGSNDLTQYVMAAGRDNGAVAGLNDVTHPAVLELIARVTRYGAESGIPVSLCGDAGSDPAIIPSLLAAGLRSLSVSSAQLPLAKLAISGVTLGGGNG
jgi:phosphotransferase system enzyme I (PtsI)